MITLALSESERHQLATRPSENGAVIDGKVGLYWAIKQWLLSQKYGSTHKAKLSRATIYPEDGLLAH